MHLALLFIVLGTVERVWSAEEVLPRAERVWPRPQIVKSYNTYMIINPSDFQFIVKDHTCYILDQAIERYTNWMISSITNNQGYTEYDQDNNFMGQLSKLEVNLEEPCEELPHQDMDEQYEIKINSVDNAEKASLTAPSVWGILRGLETFYQLLEQQSQQYKLYSTHIQDSPRLQYRGLMIDTAYDFLTISQIEETLDLMAMNKLNMFHWHIVDDESFPYVSTTYPELSNDGAFSSKEVYSVSIISHIIEYGRLRGIRVVPEFETPGHTQSWKSQQGLLTSCYKNNEPDGTLGPIDPTNEANYEFLEKLFSEVTSRFPDEFVHIGGKDVSFDCWKSNDQINTYMLQENIGDYSELGDIYTTRLLNIIHELPKQPRYLVREDVFNRNIQIDKQKALVQVDKNETVQLFQKALEEVTSAGYYAVLSSCYNLHENNDWKNIYACDPQDFSGTDNQKALVLGGEACMLGEYKGDSDFISSVWPRASALAEKLWSNTLNTGDSNAASPRLEEQCCRMYSRGHGVTLLNPSLCTA